MSKSIFTKIIEGELPCYKLYEDDHTFSFITLDQIQLGHTLVVPKVEVDHFIDVPEPYYSAVFLVAKKLSKAIHKATGCKRVGTVILGWDVPHFHYHLIPMNGMSDIDFSKAKQRPEQDCKAMQEKIIANLA